MSRTGTRAARPEQGTGLRRHLNSHPFCRLPSRAQSRVSRTRCWPGPGQAAVRRPRRLPTLQDGLMVPGAALGSVLLQRWEQSPQVSRPSNHTPPLAELAEAARSAFRLNMACSYPRILYLWIFLRLQGQKHTDISVKICPSLGHTGRLSSGSGSQPSPCQELVSASLVS